MAYNTMRPRHLEDSFLFGHAIPSSLISPVKWIPFILLIALIFVFSMDSYTRDYVYTADYISSLPDPYAGHLWTAYNKARHVLAFLLLGLSTFPLRTRRARFRLAVLCCALVGCASELVQLFSQSHVASVQDAALDVAAAAIGAFTIFRPVRFSSRPNLVFLPGRERSALAALFRSQKNEISPPEPHLALKNRG